MLTRSRIWAVLILFVPFLASCSLTGTQNGTEPYKIQQPQIGEPYYVETTQNERVNNCDGRSPTYRVRRSLLQENVTTLNVESEGKALIGGDVIPGTLQVQLEARIQDTIQHQYGEHLGEEKEILLETESGVIRDYRIVWKDKKVKGYIEIVYPTGVARVNFEKTVGIEQANRTSTLYSCDSIPPVVTPVAQPTLPPQPIATAIPEPTFVPPVDRWLEEVNYVPQQGTVLSWRLTAGQLLFLTGGQLRLNGQYCGGDAKQICVVVYTATKDQTVTADALIVQNNYYGVSSSLKPEEALGEKEPQFWYAPNCVNGCTKATVLFFVDGQQTDKRTLRAP